MSRPVPYSVARDAVTLFADRATAGGISSAGQVVAGVGRPRLVDFLNAGAQAGARLVIVCGKRLPPRFLEQPLSHGWSASRVGHYYDSDDPCGRFVDAYGRRVDVRHAAGWHYPSAATAQQVALAHRVLGWALRQVDERASVFDSPTATGQQLWALSLPPEWDAPQLDDDTAALVRATSPQHRMEVTAGCYAGCDLHWRPTARTAPAAHYLDGRWMFASLLRELGVPPVTMLTGDAAGELFFTNLYARARYHVRYTVPDDWAHVGVLMEKHPDGHHWHAPSAPGYTGETWCDGAELHVALHYGWRIDFLGGMAFSKPPRGKGPLDTWRDRILRAALACGMADIEDGAVSRMAERAVRAILVTTIGGFHSTGRDRTLRFPSPVDVPPELAASARLTEMRPDGSVIYRLSSALHGNAARFMRPELSAQVWGRSHVRLLDSAPDHRKAAPVRSGALYLPGDAVLGMWGDALYLDRDPGWTDDGAIGRLRTKGHIAGRVRRPGTLTALNNLRVRIEKASGE